MNYFHKCKNLFSTRRKVSVVRCKGKNSFVIIKKNAHFSTLKQPRHSPLGHKSPLCPPQSRIKKRPFHRSFSSFIAQKRAATSAAPPKNNLLPSWLWGKETKMLLYHQLASIYHIAMNNTYEVGSSVKGNIGRLAYKLA